MSLKLALWGGNGHQIHGQVADEPSLELVAFGGFDETVSRELKQQFPDARDCENYADLISTPNLDLVSLCSPLRSEQAEHAIMALKKEISVYAEKPCALTEKDLDRIINVTKESRAVFHEMAGTIFEQPYWQMTKSVQQGVIGEVIQVCAQKSYPMYPGRPLDEKVDGGLMVQNGVTPCGLSNISQALRLARLGALKQAWERSDRIVI
jgi:predicted dehydrogenase